MNKIVPYAISLFILAFSLGILFSSFFDVATITPDAVQYDRIAKNIAFGNGFSLEDKAPYKPTMFREPLYPYFLSLIYKIFGHKSFAVLITQSAIHGATSLLTLMLGTMLFKRQIIGILCGFFTAINITLANFCAYLLTETIFIFLLMGMILCFYIYLKEKKITFILLGSFMLGLCTLTKAGSIFLIFFLLLGILIHEVLKREFKLLRFIGVSVLSVVVIAGMILPWSIRNERIFNTSSLTYRIGVHLYSRATKIKDSAKTVFATSVYNLSEFAGKRLFPEAIDRPSEYLYKGLWQAERLKKEYTKKGLSSPEADKKVFMDAAKMIKEHPLKYILYTPIEGIKLLSFSYIPVLNEDFVIEKFNNIKNGNLMLSAIRLVFKIYGFFIFALSIGLFFKRKKNVRNLILIWMGILYFGLVYSLSDAYARYFVIFIPFFTMMSVSFFLPNINSGKG